MLKITLASVAIISLVLITAPAVFSDGLIANHNLTGHWQEIPTATVNQAVAENRIYYVHTSHGSQLVTGLTQVHELAERFPDLNYYPNEIIEEVGDDLGYDSDTSWAAPTRTYLNSHPECTIVIYSWCGGVSYNSEAGINVYLNMLNSLEAEYPGVTFVYMTGHLDGSGPSGNLYQRNNQIRQYCTANNKVLFDFADIESYDPDGNYYPDASDACEWCGDWCDDPENGCDNSCSCAHSHCFNCRLKAQTFWCLLAFLEGWRPTAIEPRSGNLPTGFGLLQNYPNPFNGETAIEYQLPQAGQVSVNIYDVNGVLLKNLVDSFQPAGNYHLAFSAGGMASGVYLYKIKADDYEESRKMILIK